MIPDASRGNAITGDDMTEPILKAQQLSHTYGNYPALVETNLDLFPGEIVTLNGPNGAGKTTLLLCLSGLMRPTQGSVRVGGYDLYADEPEAKTRLAFVPDVPRFYTELTAWEHLRFIALAHGAAQGFDQRAEGLLRSYGLWEARDLFPHHFSRGMRLKLGLVMALIRPFQVLMLDEPTSALDEDGVATVRQELLRRRNHGAAILLSSHDPAFSRGLADRFWRIDHGRIQVNDNREPLLSTTPERFAGDEVQPEDPQELA
jgi:ABC-2 type transport system ATP-binding protein